MMLSPKSLFLSGINLEIKLGQSKRKAPIYLMEAFRSAEVTLTDEGPSGFQLIFQLTKTSFSIGPFSGNYAKIMKDMAVDNRVLLVLSLKTKKHILMDGIIKHQETLPDSGPGTFLLTVKGQDVSVAMDKKADKESHPGLNDAAIVRKILKGYSSFGIIPKVMEPPYKKSPKPDTVVPVQDEKDLQYIKRLAKKWGYVFYVTPSSFMMGKNEAYWGPRKKRGLPQKALMVNMGDFSNVKDDIDFTYDSEAARKFSSLIQDAETNKITKVAIAKSKGTSLVKKDAMKSQKDVDEEFLYLAGGTVEELRAMAQALTDSSLDKVVVAEGELDVLAYGDVLKPFQLVEVKGANDPHNGKWYVAKVTHKMVRGEYRVNFSLSREGLGS